MHVYIRCVQCVHAMAETIAEQLHMFHAHSVQFLFADQQTKTRIREKHMHRTESTTATATTAAAATSNTAER